jgi:prolyl-tRNA synthetase
MRYGKTFKKLWTPCFGKPGIATPIFLSLSPKAILRKKPNMWKASQKNVAVVTHSKLEHAARNGGLKVAGELTEPYIVRPTSETITVQSFASGFLLS